MYFGNVKRVYQRNWTRKRRKRLVAKLGGKCVSCGAATNLDFHHKDPLEKKAKISSLISYSARTTDAELAKCELRCKDCHKRIHGRTLVHGTSTGYGYGCRCVACTAANTRARAEYRARTGKR